MFFMGFISLLFIIPIFPSLIVYCIKALTGSVKCYFLNIFFYSLRSYFHYFIMPTNRLTVFHFGLLQTAPMRQLVVFSALFLHTLAASIYGVKLCVCLSLSL